MRRNLMRAKTAESAGGQLSKSAQYPCEQTNSADSWISLGRLRRARGDCAAAKELFGKALESYESRYSADDANGQLLIALVLAELGRTATAEGDVTTALDYHRRSLAIRRNVFPLPQFPSGHPVLANALRDSGSRASMQANRPRRTVCWLSLSAWSMPSASRSLAEAPRPCC